MNRLITFAIVAMLLPGLAIAAPIAGSCGLCGDGDECHMGQSPKPEMESHSCCEADTETLPEPSLGSSNCECGRDAPPALTAETTTTVETTIVMAPIQDAFGLISQVGAASSCSTLLAAPPPAPPAFLIACAFLT